MRAIIDCVIVLKPGDDIDLGRTMNGYAILPRETFESMGGVEHPAYLAAVKARRDHDAEEAGRLAVAQREFEATPAGRIEALEHEVAELRDMIESK